MGVDCKFLNFGVNIEKALKLHGLKMYFPLKYMIGAFWEKMLKWSNCHNLKVWKGLSVTFETLEIKVQMGG
jgi:hypothetical protein